MLASVVETVVDRLEVGDAAEEDLRLQQSAVGDARPGDVGERQRLFCEIQLQEVLLGSGLAAEVRPPDHVESRPLPDALGILSGRRCPDEPAQQP